MAKKTSIGTWAYSVGPYENNPVPFDDVISKLKALGFDGLELGAFPPHPNPDTLTDEASRAEVRSKMADAGLEFSGLAPNLWMHKIVDTDDLKPYYDELDKNIKFAKDLGITMFRVDSLDEPDVVEKVGAEKTLDKVVSVFKEVAKRCGDEGLTVCWEFEPGFCMNKPSEILQVVEQVDAPNFGVLYDTCHANMVAKVGSRQPGEKETLPGGALELLEKLKGKITHVHLIDSDDTLHHDETSSHPPFGEGNLDFDALMPPIMDCGLKHDWWVVDLCFWPGAWEATEKCKKFLDEQRVKYGQ
ncbi:Inosose dehydratase [Planctomycetes bacterium Pan216]|uniref:Inosose dehydratase n=1 Tax=Kolteria novifilia TaxID=2527975 RepID=A0A518BAB0_9BACT|nr:Inosose dehydratase [Planctomycetes bacterium Pan216]